jgi:hypothetical protein
MAVAHAFIDVGCDRSWFTKKVASKVCALVEVAQWGIKNDSMDMYVTDDLDGETNGVLGCYTIEVTIFGTPSTTKVNL